MGTKRSVLTSRLVFTDEAALRQCRSGRMTRYRKLSGRLGTPDEIAESVAFLASDDIRHFSGMELFVGAGFAQS